MRNHFATDEHESVESHHDAKAAQVVLTKQPIGAYETDLFCGWDWRIGVEDGFCGIRKQPLYIIVLLFERIFVPSPYIAQQESVGLVPNVAREKRDESHDGKKRMTLKKKFQHR